MELRQRFGLSAAETMAVGDGANDLAMLGEAGAGVAYHAKPKVAEAAAVRIDHGDLSALLYMQGYARTISFSDRRRGAPAGGERQRSVRATKRRSPSALATRNSADERPSLRRASMRRVTSAGEFTGSFCTSRG